jgi:hypothetical protein
VAQRCFTPAEMSLSVRTVVSKYKDGGDVADGRAIEWTEATWNPTTGCDPISAGCDHYYALTLAKLADLARGDSEFVLDRIPGRVRLA